MPELPLFAVVASTQAARTVFLSGDTSALLFSALAAINDFHQWSNPGGLTPSDFDFIQTLIDKANDQLMTPNIGQIIMYTQADAPANTLPCDGETYNREDYPLLYAVLDAAYILDADTFVTPGMQSRSPVGVGEGSGLSSYTTNEAAGEETHQLTAGEMPSHSHGLFEFTALAVEPGELPVLDPNPLALRSSDSAGGDGAHNTIHPVRAVKFAVIFQ